MATSTPGKSQQTSALPPPNDPTTVGAENPNKRSLFGRFGKRLDDALVESRGAERAPQPAAANATSAETKELAIRRERTVNPGRMIIPDGAVIEGSVNGGTDTEIGGNVKGDIVVKGHLVLGPSAVVNGNIRAGSCRIDGLVEGTVECSETVELGQNGRLNADVTAEKRVALAGQVHGNVVTRGLLQLSATSKVHGDIQARGLAMEEGAALNGTCSMRAAERSTEKVS